MTPADIRRYWDDPRFEALIQRVVKLTGAERYARHVTLNAAAKEVVMDMRGGGRETYAGVLEYWEDNAARLMSDLATPEGQAIVHAIEAYQRQFVDFSASTAFFTES